LPGLQALLSQADPKVLTTERTVPLRAKAARAILAIDPLSASADAARAFLAGEAPARAAGPAVPERARSRIPELLADLTDPSRREGATANLAALGSLAVPAITQALAKSEDPAFREAALAVLREVGPSAADAVPQLMEFLLSWPTTHTLSLVRALTAAVPACRDVVPPPHFVGGASIWLYGRVIGGEVGLDFLNELTPALMAFEQALTVDPRSTLPELQALLAHPRVQMRETALVVLRARGSAARSVLPVLAAMLEQKQPTEPVAHWRTTDAITIEQRDRNDAVHGLVAQAILAIAAPADPLVGVARETLAKLAAKEPPK
jgi:hypothetical protein